MVVALEAGLTNDLVAKTMTNALRQQVVDSAEHSLRFESPLLVVKAIEAKCSLTNLANPLNEASDLAFDAGCLKRLAAHLGAKRFFWGLVFSDRGQPVVKMHFWQEGENDRVLTLPYDDEARERLAERFYRKLAIPERVGDVALVSTAAIEGDVYVDGRSRGPFRPGVELTLLGGEHTIEVLNDDKIVARTSVRVVAGRRRDVILRALGEVGTARPTTQAPVAPPPPVRSGQATWGWVALGAGVATLGAGVVSSLRAKSIDDDLSSNASYVAYRQGFSGGDICDAAKAGLVSPQAGAAGPDQVRSRCNAGATFQTLQYVFYGVGAVAAGAGTYLLLTSPKSAGARANLPKGASVRWQWGPELDAQRWGLAVTGQF